MGNSGKLSQHATGRRKHRRVKIHREKEKKYEEMEKHVTTSKAKWEHWETEALWQLRADPYGQHSEMVW